MAYVCVKYLIERPTREAQVYWRAGPGNGNLAAMPMLGGGRATAID